MRSWALAATAGLVLYVILTTPYQLDLWPYADALGFGSSRWRTATSPSTTATSSSCSSSSSSSRLGLLLAPRLARARRYRLGPRDRGRRCALVLAWNVAGEVSASNGVNNFSQNLLGNFPSPPTWIDDATGGKPAIYLGQQITDPQGIWLMEFWNKGLTYVWSLDGTAPPPGRQAPGYVTPDAAARRHAVRQVDPAREPAGRRLHGRRQVDPGRRARRSCGRTSSR